MDEFTPRCHKGRCREGFDGERFYCLFWGDWFALDGAECRRCEAGAPAPVDQYRDYIQRAIGDGRDS